MSDLGEPSPTKAIPYTRKPEVTRTVHFSQPTDQNDSKSVTPSRRQTITWAGPYFPLLGYETIECTEDFWLDHIHPADRAAVLSSLSDFLLPKPGSPYSSDSRIWGRDYRFRHAGGDYILVSDRSITFRDEDGNALFLTSVIFDKEKRSLERQEHQQRLASENHLSVVADNTPSGIFLMDSRGYSTYMNHAAEQITGFTFEEIYDYTFHASCHSCHRDGQPYPIVDCPIFQCQQKNGWAKNQPEVFVHKDGHHYDIVYSVSPVGDNASGGAVIEFRDVTEEKRIERERMDALLMNEQQSIRIKESEVHKANMTSFVSFVCHELRNPLQGVTSSAEFLTDTLEKLDALTNTLSSLHGNGEVQHSNAVQHRRASVQTMADLVVPQQHQQNAGAMGSAGIVSAPTLIAIEGLLTYAKELVSNIATCASHQALITNNVLDLSRLDAGKVEPSFDLVDVQALGQQTVAMMAARAQVKSINLGMANPAGSPLYLKADPTLLSQVLLNLISNAIKFTPEQGKIEVDLYAGGPDSSGQVILHGAVTDNGLGMSESEQQRVFQRFSQANRKVAQLYGGSGLGLSISKELVRVMGGEMHVKSQSGKGSTFSFTSLHETPTKAELLEFLRDSSSAREVHPLPGQSPLPSPTINVPTPPRFRMVCVAEDNPINLKHLAKVLRDLGYPHVLCTNGKEALDRFVAVDSIIDAVIIDMSMPVMDGLEATKKMREHELSSSRFVEIDEANSHHTGSTKETQFGGKDGIDGQLSRDLARFSLSGSNNDITNGSAYTTAGASSAAAAAGAKSSSTEKKNESSRQVPIIALSGNAMKEQVDAAMAVGTSDYLVKPCKKADLAETLAYWERVVHLSLPHRAMPGRRRRDK